MWLLALLLALLLLRPAAATEEEAFPRAEVQAVLATALAAVLERQLERADPIDLGLWSLRGLEVLEPRLKAEARPLAVPGARPGAAPQFGLSLALAGRPLAPRPLLLAPPPAGSPAEAAAPALAQGLAVLYEAGWRASPALRRAGSAAMLRSGFEELFNHLDPYSRYVAPEEALAARSRRTGQVGLGLRLAAGRAEEVVLAAIAADGPAARGGLRPGDRLLAIDGEAVSARDLTGAAARLEGPLGGAVVLLLRRGGGRRFEVALTRSTVPPENLQAERRDDILWLRLQGFSSATDRRLTEALLAARQAGRLRGVVLDLRGNRGGLLSQAVAVAGAFLAGGPVAQTSGRHRDAGRRYLATAEDLAGGLPLVVLIDGRTASAAEIVAAALGDRGRAVLVGSATTGKGLIQAVVPLPDGGELLVTWSRVLAPRGWPIQSLGVLPALCTSLGAETTMAGFARLKRGEAPMALPLARLRAARPPVLASEAAALRDSCPPAEGPETDASWARLLIETPEAYAAALAPQ